VAGPANAGPAIAVARRGTEIRSFCKVKLTWPGG
jgi:hypothetical protein